MLIFYSDVYQLSDSIVRKNHTIWPNFGGDILKPLAWLSPSQGGGERWRARGSCVRVVCGVWFLRPRA